MKPLSSGQLSSTRLTLLFSAASGEAESVIVMNHDADLVTFINGFKAR